jgi:hypothetical protein
MRALTIALMMMSPVMAFADGEMPAMDKSGIPAECAQFAKEPEGAKIAGPAIEARISVATCSAGVKLNALQVKPDDASADAMAAAMKPSFDLLNGSIAQNDPAWTPVATRARADLIIAMAVRMRNSVPAITAETVGQALADHDKAHAAIEAKIQPWLAQLH